MVGLLSQFILQFVSRIALLKLVCEILSDSLDLLSPFDALKSCEFEYDALCIRNTCRNVGEYSSLYLVPREVTLTVSFNMESCHTTAL